MVSDMTASEVQKERTKALEAQADELLKACGVCSLASVNEKGYPRICTLAIVHADSFHDLYFISSKRSELNGKVTHFEKNDKASVCYTKGCDSVTLIGTVRFVTDRETQAALWREEHRAFFKNGIDDPKFRLLHFHTLEATFWIQGKFRTCKYR